MSSRPRVRLFGRLYGTRRSSRFRLIAELEDVTPFGSPVRHFAPTGRVRLRLGRRWLTGWRPFGPWMEIK